MASPSSPVQRPAPSAVFADISNQLASQSAKRRRPGRKRGQGNFEIYGHLPPRAKSARARPVPSPDHQPVHLPSHPPAHLPADPPAHLLARPPVSMVHWSQRPPSPPQFFPPIQPPILPPAPPPCAGAYRGNVGPALSLVGRAYCATGQALIDMAAHRDGGLAAFRSSDLGLTSQVLLPHRGLAIERAMLPADGFVLRSAGCTGTACPDSRRMRCDTCHSNAGNVSKYASRAHNPFPTRPHPCTRISVSAKRRTPRRQLGCGEGHHCKSLHEGNPSWKSDGQVSDDRFRSRDRRKRSCDWYLIHLHS